MAVLTVSPSAAIDRRISGLTRCGTSAPAFRFKSQPDFQNFRPSRMRFGLVWCGRRDLNARTAFHGLPGRQRSACLSNGRLIS